MQIRRHHFLCGKHFMGYKKAIFSPVNNLDVLMVFFKKLLWCNVINCVLLWLFFLTCFKVVCKYLSFDSTVSDYQLLQGVAQAAKVYYNYTGSSPCLNTSQTATSSLGYLGWFYQVHKTAQGSVTSC